MGMFTVSSGMSLNPQCSTNASSSNQSTGNLGETQVLRLEENKAPLGKDEAKVLWVGLLRLFADI